MTDGPGDGPREERPPAAPPKERGDFPGQGHVLGGKDATRDGRATESGQQSASHQAAERRREEQTNDPQARERAAQRAREAAEAEQRRAERQAQREADATARARARAEALEEQKRLLADEQAREEQRDAERQAAHRATRESARQSREAAEEADWQRLLADLRDKSGGNSGEHGDLSLADARALLARYEADGLADPWHRLAAELGVDVESLARRGLMPDFPRGSGERDRSDAASEVRRTVARHLLGEDGDSTDDEYDDSTDDEYDDSTDDDTTSFSGRAKKPVVTTPATAPAAILTRGIDGAGGTVTRDALDEVARELAKEPATTGDPAVVPSGEESSASAPSSRERLAAGALLKIHDDLYHRDAAPEAITRDLDRVRALRRLEQLARDHYRMRVAYLTGGWLAGMAQDLHGLPDRQRPLSDHLKAVVDAIGGIDASLTGAALRDALRAALLPPAPEVEPVPQVEPALQVAPVPLAGPAPGANSAPQEAPAALADPVPAASEGAGGTKGEPKERQERYTTSRLTTSGGVVVGLELQSRGRKSAPPVVAEDVRSVYHWSMPAKPGDGPYQPVERIAPAVGVIEEDAKGAEAGAVAKGEAAGEDAVVVEDTDGTTASPATTAVTAVPATKAGKSARPAKAAESAKDVVAAPAAKGVKAGTSARSAKTAKPEKDAKPTKAERGAKPTKPAKPTKAAKGAEDGSDAEDKDTKEEKNKNYSLTEITGHEPFLLLISKKLMDADADTLAEAVVADLPGDVLTPETPLVLVGPSELGADLVLPRALAAATGRTVWTSSVATSLTDGQIRVRAKMRPDLEAKKHLKPERGFWIKEVPPDPTMPEAPEGSSIPTKGVTKENGRRVDAKKPDIVDESDLDSQPILFPLGRQSGGRFFRDDSLTREWEAVRDGFDPTSPHFEYLSSDFVDNPVLAAASADPDLGSIGLVPWDVSAPIYTVMTHATHLAAMLPTLSEQPANGNKKKVYVSGTGLGQVVRRRPSFRRMPPDTQIVLLACQAGALGDSGKAVAQELAEATGRVVWASTTTIHVAVGQRVAQLGILSDEHGTRGRWVKFVPGTEPDTEQGSHPPVEPESTKKTKKTKDSRRVGKLGGFLQEDQPSSDAEGGRQGRAVQRVTRPDGSSFDVLETPGDGDCLFTAVLAGADRDLGARDARRVVSLWFRGPAGAPLRESIDSREQSPLHFLLDDLTEHQVRAIAGTAFDGVGREDLVEHLRAVFAAGAPAADADAAWSRMLEQLPALAGTLWVHDGDTDPRRLTLADLRDQPLSLLVDMAVRNRSLWSSRFYDEIAQVVAHALAVRLVVHDDHGRSFVLNPEAARTVDVHRSNPADIRGAHYSALTWVTHPAGPPNEPVQESHRQEPSHHEPSQHESSKEADTPQEGRLPGDEKREEPTKPPVPPQEQPATVPAPTPVPTPLPPLPAPPRRMTEEGWISAGDRVVLVHGANGRVVEAVLAHLRAGVSAGRREEIRKRLAEQLDVRTLQPHLSRMTRGDDLLLPLDLGGGPGLLRVGATVVRAVTAHRTEKFEFEDGGDSSAGTGALRESRTRWAGGLVVSGKPASAVGVTGPATRVADRAEGTAVASTGRVTHRSKTAEPVLWVDAEILLDLDFSAVPGVRTPARPLSRTPVVAAAPRPGQEGPVSVRLSARVVTPAAESGGDAPSPTTHHAPPARVLRTAALGGMDVVKDVRTRYGRGDRADGHTALFGPADADTGLEAFGRRRFGDDWPAVRAELLAQLDLPSLQAQLRAMTAGEPLEVPLAEGRGSVLVSATVLELVHLRNTDPSEFNTGADATGVVTSSSTRAVTLGLGFSAKVSGTGKDDPVSGTGSGVLTGQRGSDRNTVGQNAQRTGAALKAKVPGAIFDGVVRLSLAHRDRTGAVGPDRARADLGFQVLFQAAECEAGEAGRTFRTDDEPGPLRAPVLPPGTTARMPAPQVWGPDPAHGRTGLPTGAVVLDVLPSGPQDGPDALPGLTDVLEGLGRRTFGAEGWTALGPAVRGAFRRERLAALLPGMSHGIDLRSPLLVRAGQPDALVLAGAEVRRLAYVRAFDEAELNIVNEWTAGSGDRRNTFRSAAGRLQGGPRFPAADTTVAATGGGGHAARSRRGDRAADSAGGSANAKFAEPMVVYLADVEVDVRVVHDGAGAPTAPERAVVRALLALPMSLTTPHPTAADGGPSRLVFTRPDVPPTGQGEEAGEQQAPGDHPSPGEHQPSGDQQADVRPPAVPLRPVEPLAVRPPDRVTRTGELGASDPVLGLHDVRAVLDAVGVRLRPVFGRHWAWVEAALAPHLDETSLRPRLAALTTGAGWTVAVSHRGYTAEVRLLRAAATMREYRGLIEKCEFERGGETVSSTGTLRDTRGGATATAAVDGTFPHVAVTLSQTSAAHGTVGTVRDTVTSRSEKEKTVERAARFTGDVTVELSVVVTSNRPSVLVGRAVRQRLADASGPMTAVTGIDVVFPVRELPVDPKTGLAPAPAEHRSVPRRIVDSGVLGGSDVLLRVWAPEPRALPSGHDRPTPQPDRGPAPQPAPVPPQPGPGHRPSLLDQLDRPGRSVYGAGWERVRSTLEPLLRAGAVQSRMRALMAGQEHFVKVPGGTVVLRWAGVREIRHTADTTETEFAAGGAGGVAQGGPDGRTGHNTATDDGVAGRLVVTTDPVGALPVSLVLGGTLSHVRGQERITEHDGAGRTGTATKTKVPGSVFTGTGVLQVELRRRGGPRPVRGTLPPAARAEQQRQRALRPAAGLPAGAPLPRPFVEELDRQNRRIRDAARSVPTPRPVPDADRRSGRARRAATTTVEFGFDVLLETSDTQVVGTPAQARHRAPGTGEESLLAPRGAVPTTTHLVPPREVWSGLGAEDLLVDLPDVGSLRNLLGTLGRNLFRLDPDSADARRLRRAFDRGTLIDVLPDLTAGGTLVRTVRLGFVDTVSVTVRAELVALGRGREEPKSEISQSAEVSTRFTERALASRMTQLMGQFGLEFSKVKGKVMGGITFGGGAGRRTGGERTVAERSVTNSKFPEPLVRFEGYAKFTFSFQHRTGPWSWRPHTVVGDVPVLVAVPKRSVTRQHTGPDDTYFTPDNWRTGRRPSDPYDLPPDQEEEPGPPVPDASANDLAGRIAETLGRVPSPPEAPGDRTGGGAGGSATELAAAQRAAGEAEAARAAELARQQAEQAEREELARQQAELAEKAELARLAESARQQAELAEREELARQQAESARLAELARRQEQAKQDERAKAAVSALQRKQAEQEVPASADSTSQVPPKEAVTEPLPMVPRPDSSPELKPLPESELKPLPESELKPLPESELKPLPESELKPLPE
ncbi:hypothetical protein ACIRS1_17110, partial [Kitasatospora sp. NPDC101176]